MNCRDVREVADSFLCEELLTETNHEILRHLDTCPSCRTELHARRRLRGALRTAFNRAPELQPAGEFADRLRDQLRQAAVHRHRSWALSSRRLALAAGLVLAAGVAAVVFLNRSLAPAEPLAQDAIGDHRNCALKYRLVRNPVPLEEAAQRFDSAYRLLLDAPPDAISTPDGPVRVVERHSCEYGAHRFGHVILQYRGRVVSLLVTANKRAAVAAESADAIPHVIGQSYGWIVRSVGRRIALCGHARQRSGERRAHATGGNRVVAAGPTLGRCHLGSHEDDCLVVRSDASGIELLAHPLTQSQFAAQGTLVGEVNGLDLVLDLHN